MALPIVQPRRAHATDESISESHAQNLNVVCWSGGHDSTLMVHYLLHQARALEEPFRVVFVDSTITFPETHEYIQEIVKDFGIRKNFVVLKPDLTFYDRLLRYNFWPSIRALWCRKLLKLDLLKRYYNGVPGAVTEYVGISRADSGLRRKMYRAPEVTRKWGKKTVACRYPLLKWTDQRKAAYFKSERIPRNPIYETMRVSGCYFCPYYHEKEYRRLRLYHPELFSLLLFCEKITGKRALPDFWLRDVGASVSPSLTDFQIQTIGDFAEALRAHYFKQA